MPKKIIFALITLLIVLVLAGCGLNSGGDTAAVNDGSWSLVTDIPLSPEADAAMQKSSNASPNQTDGTFKMTSTREVRDQVAHYMITIEGKGYDDLAKAMSMDKTDKISKGENNQVSISMSAPPAAMGQMIMTLHAKKIISSNGTSQTATTVVWDSTKGMPRMDATIEL